MFANHFLREGSFEPESNVAINQDNSWPKIQVYVGLVPPCMILLKEMTNKIAQEDLRTLDNHLNVPITTDGAH